MTAEFGYGKVYPYRLLMIPDKNQSILNADFFTNSGKVITEMAQVLPNTTSHDFQGISWGNGAGVPLGLVELYASPFPAFGLRASLDA